MCDQAAGECIQKQKNAEQKVCKNMPHVFKMEVSDDDEAVHMQAVRIVSYREETVQ